MAKKVTEKSPNEFFTQAAWAAMWAPESDYYLPNVIKNGIAKEGIKVDPMGNFMLDNVPASGSFQLMKSDNLISWLPVKSGYVGIRFSNVMISDMHNVTNGGLTYKDETDSKGTIKAKIGVPAITVSGSYTLVATGLAECALDTAAVLPMPFKDRIPGTAEPVGTDDYLDEARNQRTKLWQTKNGGLLMDKFYDHNEVYNYSFQNNKGLKNSWVQPANQHFMGTTYQASKDPNVPVNGNVYMDGENGATNYNTNAFNQKLAVAYAAFGYGKNPPEKCNITKEQFNAAGQAALQFEGFVSETGNTSRNTVPMTVNQVYGTIEGTSPEKMLAMKKKTPRNYDEFMESLSADEKRYLAAIGNVDKNLEVKDGEDASATLMTGRFMVRINSGEMTMDAGLTFTTTPDLKAIANVTSFNSNAKIASVDIANRDSWLGLQSIGSAIIEAYNNSGQIASLMEDKINKELGSDDVKKYIGDWLNNTLQKVLGEFKSERK